MRLKAMAKINLGLDVLGKREDGYHEVRMIMQTIRMYDILDIRKTKRPGIVLTTNLPFISNFAMCDPTLMYIPYRLLYCLQSEATTS